MPTCSTCQSQLREGAKFCPSCGAGVDAAAAAPGPAKTMGAAPAAGKALPPLETTPAPAAPAGRGVPWWAVGVIVAAAAVIVAGFVVLFVAGGDETADPSDVTTDGTAAPETESGSGTDDGSDDPAPTTTAAPAAVSKLSAVSAVASNTRPAVPELRCGGSADYEADNLIDGDLQTGWGAVEGDGTGEFIDIRFSGRRRLTSVGLTPGYMKVAERSDQGCSTVQSFGFNRFVTAVRYEFDDGTSVEQTFIQQPTMQTIDLTDQPETTRVRIVILGTSRPAIADDDTIMSEAEFFGSEA